MNYPISFYEILVNGEKISDDVKKYIESVSVELNEHEIDVCRIDMNIKDSFGDLQAVFKEGDVIDVYMGLFGQVTKYENVFSGRVKTIEPIFGNQSKLSIEAFEDLFLLDFSEESVESDKSPLAEVVEQMEEMAETAVEYVKSLFSGSNKTKPAVRNILESIKNKYPKLIKKIIVDEPEFALEKKMIKGKGITDYQYLNDLAKTCNRVLGLKHGVLYFVKHREKVIKPLVFYPNLAQYDDSDMGFIVERARVSTSLKGLTENVEIISANKTGEGIVLESKEAESIIATQVEPVKYSLKTLEEKKQAMDELLNEGKITQARYDDFINNEYKAVKESLNNEMTKIVDKINNGRKYYWDILAKLPNGKSVRFKTNNAIVTKENAVAYAKEYLRKNARKFVEVRLDLLIGNNIFRTWHLVDVLFLNSGDYGVRYSGTYNVKKVSFEIGTQGYKTSLTLDRDYIVEN